MFLANSSFSPSKMLKSGLSCVSLLKAPLCFLPLRFTLSFVSGSESSNPEVSKPLSSYNELLKNANASLSEFNVQLDRIKT